jgi:hypothetical protein
MSAIKESFIIVVNIYENGKCVYETPEMDLFTMEGLKELNECLQTARVEFEDASLDLICVNSSRLELVAYIDALWETKYEHDMSDSEFLEILYEEFKGYYRYPESGSLNMGALLALASIPNVLSIKEAFDLINDGDYYMIKEWEGAKSLTAIGEEIAQEEGIYYDLEENNILEFFDFSKYAHRELKRYVHIAGYGYYKFEYDLLQ